MDTNELEIYYIGEEDYPEFETSTIKECYEYLIKKSVISIDIETTRKYNGKYGKAEGLDPYLSEIVMFQIGDEHRQYVIDYRIVDIDILNKILEHPGIVKVGHNIKFEYKHILHNEGIRLCNVYDTMIVEQILFNGHNLSYGLKDLNERYLGITVDKSTRLEFLNIRDRSFTSNQIKYGAEDILYPLLIRNKQLEDATKKKLHSCITLEMLFLLVLGDIEYKGMHFNKDIWTETYQKNLKESNKLRNKLNQYVLDNHSNTIFVDKQLDLFAEGINCAINWDSSKQVIEYFKFLGICPKNISKSTGKLSYTVDAKVLNASLNTINKNIEENVKQLLLDYLNYKETVQSCTTFGLDYFKYINPVTNRVHSNYNQVLNTGRISSRGPNLQNIPADGAFRRAFDCPKGYKIINADYSGQEQIILANKSQDKDIISFYEQKLGDMHSFVASKIFPELNGLSLKEIKEKHADKRQLAKAAGFAINYGGNGYTIAENLGISQTIGDTVYEAYFKAFPGLKNYFNKIQKASIRQGFVLIDPISERKYFFNPPTTGKEFGKINRLALNYPIQGEAGGITKYAAILYRQWILDNNLQDKVFITNLVHDEINIEALESCAVNAANALEECMQKSADKWCKIVPLTADAKITTYWNH